MRRRSPEIRWFLAVAATLVTAIALAGGAGASPPLRELFVFEYSFVDDDTCAFPIAVEGVFENAIIDSTIATGTGRLQLHQSDVATLTANDVTLHVNSHYTIMVEFVDGVPLTAKHVGVLDDIRGPGGHVFQRTGQAVYQVVFDPVSGFYVDGPLVTRHGIRADFDAAAFCAAFG
jgi:hypothetical protein